MVCGPPLDARNGVPKNCPSNSGRIGVERRPINAEKTSAAGAFQPLSGVLVVSIEQAVAAPTCTCCLADAGARVIKIERPEGDFARHYDRLAGCESAYFVWLNRGQESVVLDLT